MNLDILHEKIFLKDPSALELFERIKMQSFNEEVFVDKGNYKMPRLIKWYGDIPYAYANIYHPALPIPDFIIHVMENINNYLKNKNISSKMNSVLVNYYRDGTDKINYHSDDLSQIGENPVIVSLSLGETRTFLFKNKETKIKNKIELGNGDLLVMKGKTQQHWEHAILPEKNKGERINLTFRNTIYQPNVS